MCVFGVCVCVCEGERSATTSGPVCYYTGQRSAGSLQPRLVCVSGRAAGEHHRPSSSQVRVINSFLCETQRRVLGGGTGGFLVFKDRRREWRACGHDNTLYFQDRTEKNTTLLSARKTNVKHFTWVVETQEKQCVWWYQETLKAQHKKKVDSFKHSSMN